jgi:hypothetical protein
MSKYVWKPIEAGFTREKRKDGLHIHQEDWNYEYP